MNAFLKTLFGDMGTVSVVVIVMTAEVLFAVTGQLTSAALAVPPLVLAGTAWLATR
ncbi:MAG: hypothetical protein QOI46_4566 [Alphaproteobacteria bacterium]|jgi:hypothetical protein|nr:hypothetical protein [Alphaproteobacteria bacterium]